jgi:hypothetical protein
MPESQATLKIRALDRNGAPVTGEAADPTADRGAKGTPEANGNGNGKAAANGKGADATETAEPGAVNGSPAGSPRR